jgi:hypothetical protein
MEAVEAVRGLTNDPSIVDEPLEIVVAFTSARQSMAMSAPPNGLISP